MSQWHEKTVREGVPATAKAYVTNIAEAAITQATVNAVTYIAKQYNSRDEAEADSDATVIQTETSAGAVASTVFDTLQAWDVDSTGFNLKVTLPAATFPTGGKFVHVEVWIDPTSGEDFIGFSGIFEVVSTLRD